jgi:hypothetical protein
MITEQKYIWMDASDYFKGIVTDLEKLSRDPDYHPEDKLYELGPELKLEVNVKVILKNPIFRSQENKE